MTQYILYWCPHLDDSVLKSGADVELALLDVEDELRLQLLRQVGLRQAEEGHQTLQGGSHDGRAAGQTDLNNLEEFFDHSWTSYGGRGALCFAHGK